MDVFYFILIFVGMGGMFYLLVMWDRRAKQSYKDKANDLLLMSDPNPKEVRDVIKNLRLYAGRFKKDKEAINLITKLQNKHKHIFF